MITLLNHNSQNWEKYSVLFKDAWADLKAKGRLTDRDAAKTDAVAFSNIQHYLSYIQELMDIDKKYLLLPLDEAPFEINANTREIKIPPEFAKCSGVQTDNYAEIITFTIDRYFDYKDLLNATIAVQWVNANNEAGISIIDLIDKETLGSENKIRFGWPLVGEMTAAAGSLKFAVRFFTQQVDESGKKQFSYIFNTTPASIPIKSTLNVDFDGENVIKKDDDFNVFKTFVTNSMNPSYAIPTAVQFTSDDASIPSMNLPESADIDIDTDDLTLFAYAITKDLNPIVYEWYRKKGDILTRIPTGTSDPSYLINEAYYEEYSPEVWPTKQPPSFTTFWELDKSGEPPYGYKIFEGDWPEERPSGEKALYLKKTSLYFKPEGGDVTGKYFVRGYNRNDVNEVYTDSRSCEIAAPAPLEIKGNLERHMFLPSEGGKLSITVNEDQKNPTRTYTLKNNGSVVGAPLVTTSHIGEFNLAPQAFGTYVIDVSSELNRAIDNETSLACWVTDYPLEPKAKDLTINPYRTDSDTQLVTTTENDYLAIDSAAGDILDLTVNLYAIGESYDQVRLDDLGNPVKEDGEDIIDTISYTEFNTANKLDYSWSVQTVDSADFVDITEKEAGRGIIASADVKTNTLRVKVLSEDADNSDKQVYTFKCKVVNKIETESKVAEFTFIIK